LRHWLSAIPRNKLAGSFVSNLDLYGKVCESKNVLVGECRAEENELAQFPLRSYA